MEKRIETAVNRIIENLKEKGFELFDIGNISIEREDLSEGMLITVTVRIPDGEDQEFQILFPEETEEDYQ